MMVHRTTPKAHQKRTSASLDEQGLGVSGSHSRCAVRHETFSPLYRDSASWRWEETLRRMLITPIRVGQPRRKRSYSHVRTERRDPATLPPLPIQASGGPPPCCVLPSHGGRVRMDHNASPASLKERIRCLALRPAVASVRLAHVHLRSRAAGILGTQYNTITRVCIHRRSVRLQRNFKMSFTSFRHTTSTNSTDGLIRV